MNDDEGRRAGGAMPESLRTRFARWGFNLFPCYRRTGARIARIAGDWTEVRVRLPFNWKTRNYVGTLFGGSVYAAVDPIYMIMLIKTLGPGYEVWDKAAHVRFLHPGRSTLSARFVLEEGELQEIRDILSREEKVDRVYRVELTDGRGEVCAAVEKTLHIRRRGLPSRGR